ncbi:hypothetical protein [Plebeiibacterium sediminum]|uniref:Uncharacterized protein n=1 Tax=Plebeiibacterium sediminum TaxID=2992112 RepID=A0AAE3SHJ0_9BACT|nr:hypothetical protein [Plebeiobacterium sediminum]MCW3789466.1 hypothetical protein [Plebeiobacterium sediminum]
MKDKIILTKEMKVALLNGLRNGYFIKSELYALFSSVFGEQPLFVDDDEIIRINRVLEENC